MQDVAEGERCSRGAHRDRLPAAIVSGEYKLGGGNSDELLNRMFPVAGTDFHLSTNFIDAKLTGDLLQQPA